MLLISTHIGDDRLMFILQKYVNEQNLIALDTLFNIFKEINLDLTLKIPKTFFVLLDSVLDDQLIKISPVEYSGLIQNCFWKLFLIFCNHLSETFDLLASFDHLDIKFLEFLLIKLGRMTLKYSSELMNFLKEEIDAKEDIPIFNENNRSRFDYINKVFLWYRFLLFVIGFIKLMA